MTPLALQKQILLLEAAVHREELERARAGFGGRLRAARRTAEAWRWPLVAAAIGLGLAMRRAARPAKWLPLGMLALRVAGTVAGVAGARRSLASRETK